MVQIRRPSLTRRGRRTRLRAALLCGLAAAGALAARDAAAAGPPTLSGAAAFGDWQSDQPGLRRIIRPGDLPPPFATPSAASGPRAGTMPASPSLKVPPGFDVTLLAQGLQAPREIKIAPNGDIFIAESDAGRIRVLRADGSGDPGRGPIFASGLDGPFGLLFYPESAPTWLYVATPRKIVRYPYAAGDQRASSRPSLVAELDISDGGHFTRDLAVSPDGTRLFVSIGSRSNDAERLGPGTPAQKAALPKGAAWGEEENRAAVLSFTPEGREMRIYATGLRNCAGLARDAEGNLVCTVNERDGLGDDLPPDYVTVVREGGFYGWPWYYIGAHEDPRHKGERPDLSGEVKVPNVLLQPHSAPIGLAFYHAPRSAPARFSSFYRDSLFVALHGSWNRSKRTGYKVVRIPIIDGRLSPAYEDFLTGFVNADGTVWGRPVGIAVAQDGALLVSEDQSGTIWRVSPKPHPPEAEPDEE